MIGEPPACVGSNHVPGCDHFKRFDPEPLASFSPPPLDELRPRPTLVHDHPSTAIIHAYDGLSLRVDVRVTRRGRAKCRFCRRKRVLFALTAFSADQPVGYGTAMCLGCAGLRPKGA